MGQMKEQVWDVHLMTDGRKYLTIENWKIIMLKVYRDWIDYKHTHTSILYWRSGWINLGDIISDFNTWGKMVSYVTMLFFIYLYALSINFVRDE